MNHSYINLQAQNLDTIQAYPVKVGGRWIEVTGLRDIYRIIRILKRLER